MQFLWIFIARITNFVKRVSIPAFTTGLLIGIYPAHSNFIDYIDTAQKIILTSVAVFTAIWTHKRFSYPHIKSEAEDLLGLIKRISDRFVEYELNISLFCEDAPQNKKLSDGLQKETKMLTDLISEILDFYIYKSFTTLIDRELIHNLWRIMFDLNMLDFSKEQDKMVILSLIKECTENVNQLRIQVKKSVSDLN